MHKLNKSACFVQCWLESKNLLRANIEEQNGSLKAKNRGNIEKKRVLISYLFRSTGASPSLHPITFSLLHSFLTVVKETPLPLLTSTSVLSW